MNTNFTSCKAKIITPFIRLNRTPSAMSDRLYELDVESICRLTDMLSKGNIIDYLYIASGVPEIDGDGSLRKMCGYINETLTEKEKTELFGTGFYDGDDMYSYVSNTDAVKNGNTTADITRFVNRKYSFREGKFVRVDSIYKNY